MSPARRHATALLGPACGLLGLVCGPAGCRLVDGGLGDGGVADGGAEVGPATPEDARRAFDLPPQEVFEAMGPFSLTGAPSAMGCADGSREGFLNATARGWPDIAGCAGGWSIPGLRLGAGRTPACGRNSGDTSANPAGAGCAAADLCAEGWHICQGPVEVYRLSASQCESAVPLGVTAFFAVAGGGSPTGDCVFGEPQVNDVRGCGNLGQPEGDGCFPLDRRLEFGDCLATSGVWNCGRAEHNQMEVEKVYKTHPSLGGVLCCRDER